MPSIDAIRLQTVLRTSIPVRAQQAVQNVPQQREDTERISWKGVVYSMALGCAAFTLPSLICIPFFSLGWIIPTALAGTSLLSFVIVGKGDDSTRRINSYLHEQSKGGGYI